MPSNIIVDLGTSKENRWKAYFPWVAGLVLLAVLVAVGGFFLGRIDGQQNIFGLDDTSNHSNTREGWLVLEKENFLVEYPENWAVGETEIGVTISKDSGFIEFFFDSIRQSRFSNDQKSNTKSNKQSEIDIDGRKAQLTEKEYKDGQFFISVILPSEGQKTKATLWIAANNSDVKNEALEIVKTYQEKSAE